MSGNGEIVASAGLAVVYLNRCRKREESGCRDRFIAAYRQFTPAIPHRLYVINKGFLSDELRLQHEAFATISPRFVDVSDEGFDLTAYLTASDSIEEDTVFFMNTFAEPVRQGWLEKVWDAFLQPGVGLAGCTASFETHYPIRPNFPAFPNFHVRTNAFMINRKLFIDILSARVPVTKDDCYELECGNSSLTRLVKNAGRTVVVVGDRNAFGEKTAWMSCVFRMGTQHNLLVADNHTREYAEASIPKKIRIWSNSWLGLGRLSRHQVAWSWNYGKLGNLRASIKRKIRTFRTSRQRKSCG